MKEFFEKLKKENKNAVIAVLLVMTLVVALCVGCGKDNNADNQDNTQQEVNNGNDNSQNQDSTEDGSNVSDDTTDEGNAEDESNEDESQNSGETGDASGEQSGETSSGTENEGTSSDNSSSSNDGGTSSDEGSSSEETESDVIGSGTQSDPYQVIPDIDTMTFVTDSIPAGGSICYSIHRVGGMILEIASANAYVIDSAGTRHDATNGVVTFEIESALASEFVFFEIGNKGGNAESFTIKFINKTGSYANPSAVSSLVNNSYQIHLDEGNEIGHYYKYVAEKDGVIRFSISSITSKVTGAITVTNNRSMAQERLEEATDNTTYIEIEVKKGDELMICVSACPNRRGKYLEADITWMGQYLE